jgi:hypothetical protein
MNGIDDDSIGQDVSTDAAKQLLAQQIIQLLQQEDCLEAIAQTLGNQLQHHLICPKPESDTVVGSVAPIRTEQVYPRYPGLVKIRRYLSYGAASLWMGCVWNIITPFGAAEGFNIALSISSISCGLILVILLVSEVFLGAGEEIATETHCGDRYLVECRFIPSVRRLPYVLGILALGFISILLGFASLYAELVRLNPSNFSGLQDGLLAIYFALVTFSTVGYGDIYAMSAIARCTVVAEIAIAMFFSLVVISTTLSWITAYERQQHDESIRNRIQQLQRDRQKQQRFRTAPTVGSDGSTPAHHQTNHSHKAETDPKV